jgi:hypothetical protein
VFAKLLTRLFGPKVTPPDATAVNTALAPAPSEEDDLDALITRAADTRARDDHERVLAALEGKELFLSLARNAEGRTTMRTASLESGLKPVILYTASDHPDLVKPMGGIVWEEALRMVAKLPDTAGLLLQSRSTGWIAIDKRGAAAILARQ